MSYVFQTGFTYSLTAPIRINGVKRKRDTSDFSGRLRSLASLGRGLIFVAIGAFSMAGAICNWDWFMNARKARFMVRILTRNGARIFYGFLGGALVVLGVLMIMGVILS